ncbi:MAG: YdeI/OmpD-associated family protein [Bacteroidota bacterium]
MRPLSIYYHVNRSSFSQTLQQLEKRKGGYFYLTLMAEVVDGLSRGKATRLICEVDEKVSFPCGLNHLGDGNFFIIVAGKYLKVLNKTEGDQVSFVIFEDPNPLGVDVPEVLQVLLDQDPQAQSTYEQLTDGKKRSLIYQIKPVKDVDLAIQKVLSFLEEERLKAMRKANKGGTGHLRS